LAQLANLLDDVIDGSLTAIKDRFQLHRRGSNDSHFFSFRIDCDSVGLY